MKHVASPLRRRIDRLATRAKLDATPDDGTFHVTARGLALARELLARYGSTPATRDALATDLLRQAAAMGD